MLGLPGQTRTPWAMFDTAHYAAERTAAGAAPPPDDPAAARLHYLEHGQRDGQSPNRWIDEAWLRAQPLVAEAIRSGRAQSGFDAYCRAEGEAASPHWLFSERLYRTRYADLTEAALRDGGYANGYDHYLREGDREGRSGSLFLDPAYALAALPANAAAYAAARGCFAWYLDCLGRVAEPRVSPWFDPAWFLARYPEQAEALARGEAKGALHRYLALAASDRLDPLEWFSEEFYLARHPDIAEAVAAGTWRSGYQHFLHHGAFERRQPSPALDLHWYASDPAVAKDIDAGLAPDPFTHFIRFGAPAGRRGTPPPEHAPSPGDAGVLMRRQAEALLPEAARARLDFTVTGDPAISVVIVIRDGFRMVLRALAALRTGFPGAIELILVDAGTTDEARHISRYATGVVRLPFEQALGWLAGANAGLSCATAPVVLFLDPEIAPFPGALAVALARLDADPALGAIGARLLGPDGSLVEAGEILWRDGSLTRYREGGAALAPEANFRRRVDGCAPGMVFLRRTALAGTGGFDPDFAAAPEAAMAHLALTLAEAGLGLGYDPAVSGQYLDTPPPIPPEGATLLAARHAERLRFRSLAAPHQEVFARSPERGTRRVLFIDDTIPVRRAGSGFVRSAELIGAMAELGWEVGVFGVAPSRFDLAALFADLPDSAEILHDRAAETLPALLAERAGYYDAIWVARTHNLRRLRAVLDRALADAPRPPAIVLDTEAIAALREAERARLAGEGFDTEAALRREFADAAICRHVVAVSEAESAILRELGLPSVTTIGHIRDIAPTARPFARRSGLLFLGAMHEAESPNMDALVWFAEQVLPLIEKALRWETRLTVAGYTGPGVDLTRFAAHPRISLRGAVAETEPLYDQHRVFVAPTRFAAGLPYKLHEAASFGLPIVASALLARQLGWDDALLAADTADPGAFAEAVVRLYRDEALWTRLRTAALERVAAETSRERTLSALRALLG
ncbi:MAG: glycosyltransferase [Rhodospirillales bacterium]|nr:glycosyltransferase [Rhodospirillales bacterium]